MSRVEPAEAPRIGLALVDPPGFDAAVIEAIESAGVAVTFFVRPEVLVLDSNLWRFVRAAGHELGMGCLLGVTDDGRLPNWTCATLEAEFRDCASLLDELGQERAGSIYMPGRYHLCAEGRYRHKVQKAFDVCIGETERTGSIGGVNGVLDMLAEPERSCNSLSLRVLPGDVRQLSRTLSFGWDVPAGPVCDLATLNPHT